MQELQSTTGDLHRCVEGLKAELRRKEAELEDMGDSNSTLQKKLNKLQPSLESYEQVAFICTDVLQLVLIFSILQSHQSYGLIKDMLQKIQKREYSSS